MAHKSIYGTVHSIMDNVFWYNACLKCNSKNAGNDSACWKCHYTGFYLRYRLMVEVDTKHGILSLSCFGNCLKRFFGIDAGSFSRDISQQNDEETLDILRQCVELCFVGFSFIFKIKNWSCYSSKSNCTLVVEDIKPLVETSETQSVYEKYKLSTSPEQFEVPENLDTFSASPKSLVATPFESNSLPSKRKRSISDSLAFLNDSLIEGLFNKSDS
uniref:Replication factor A C-terminal domain-containing protein n=1 Tax=Ciona savignyi TaxID=51511 RepID=H2Z9R8_CIOSA